MARRILLIAFVAMLSACSDAGDTASLSNRVYVQAGGSSSGNGSHELPFSTLAEAQAASSPGDQILLMPSAVILDGNIVLQPDQQLIGLAAEGGELVRVTHTAGSQSEPVVALSERNEITGLHFVDLRGPAILGQNVDFSGADVHHNRFTGAVESDAPIWACRLSSTVNISNVRVSDNLIRDGLALGGIQVIQQGTSTGAYRFERNEFYDIGNRAYHLWTQDDSSLNAEIVDSKADNIGRGDKNSDSILTHLSGSSEQTVLVKNYRYRNSGQVGNASNTGLEAFIQGAPFTGEERWCDGCRLNLRIIDSQFDGAVADGIQLTNFGSNSVFDVEIRGTTVSGAKPRQVGGGISLVVQNEVNTGNHANLLIENSEVIDSTGYGFAVRALGEGHSATIDLGGGELGSSGNNRIVGSVRGEIQATNASLVAKHNWWGGEPPRIDLQGDGSVVHADPALPVDPAGGQAP
ncbi:MAG: DUF1565 domain-containing protein [Gammaproteobacteria bacterium]|nr:DUF1565 domain-containing protein [Gammaproteobacteria bacterium]